MAENTGPVADPPEPDSEQQAIDEFERRPSTMPDIGIDLRNFATEEQANSVGREVLGILHALGKILNLKRLAQVIVAWDYNDAFANLDRGTEVSRQLAATDDGIR